MKWLVTNALSRDVEREHLNKILQDIRNNVDSTNTTVTSVVTAVNNTVLKSFTLKLAGDVTGQVKVNGSGTFTLNTSLAEEYVTEVPDDKVYARTLGSWVIPTTDDVEEATNLYFTPDRAAQAVMDAIDAGVSTGIIFDYDSGTMDVTVTGDNISDNYTNGEVFTLSVGTPVCVVSGQLYRATLTAPYNKVIGLVVVNDIASGDTGFVKATGPMVLETDEWDVVTGGSGGLTPETDYFVDNSGQLTTTIPAATGDAVYYVGYAVSATEFIVRIAVRPQRQAYKTPVEIPDGTLTIFTTPTQYLPDTLVVMLNGLVEPITELTSTTFSFVDPPLATDVIYLDYF